MAETAYATETDRAKPSRRDLLKRHAALIQERQSWMGPWKDISTYLLPRNGRYLTQDRNRGNKVSVQNDILNSHATRALRVLAAGMMAGATSQARPWFRLSSDDQDLNLWHPAMEWFDRSAKRMQSVLQRGNTYRALPQLYTEDAAFGTAASIVLPHRENVIHHHSLTVGEFAIAVDDLGDPCTLYREFDMTVAQLVKRFGLENCTLRVKNMAKNGQLDQWITVVHAIEPREDRDPSKRDSLNMAWRSVYFELGGGEEEKILRESGFKQFPCLVPRWDLAGGDIYGNGPGFEALGDIKGLQLKELRLAEAFDVLTDPPTVWPTSFKNREIDTRAGGQSFGDFQGPSGSREVRAQPQTRDFEAHIMRDERRIDEAFFKDLFLLLANSNDNDKTAAEIAARVEEKHLVLGPVMARQQDEVQEPLIDNLFREMVENGDIEEPPQEMSGRSLKVEFMGVLAQAQQRIGIADDERFIVTLGTIATLGTGSKADVLDKFDADELVDRYSNRLGLDPKYIIPGEKVALIRDARNKANAAKEQAALLEQQANTVNKLAGAPTGEDPNALTDATRAFAGSTPF